MGMAQRVKDAGESECRFVMKRIGVEPHGDIILRESVLTSYAGLTGIDFKGRCTTENRWDSASVF